MDEKKYVADRIAEIKSGKLSAKELKQLSANVTASDRLSSDGRQQVLSAIATQLRGSTPKRSSNGQSVREQFAIDLLQGVFDRSDRMFNLNRNAVDNKVKIGGDMMGGRAALDVYISYKTSKKRRISLDIRQEAEGQPAICSVKDIIVGSSQGERIEFLVEEFEKAAELYLKKLAEVVPPIEQSPGSAASMSAGA